MGPARQSLPILHSQTSIHEEKIKVVLSANLIRLPILKGVDAVSYSENLTIYLARSEEATLRPSCFWLRAYLR